MQVYPKSITALEETILFLGRRGDKKLLATLSEGDHLTSRFPGSANTVDRDGRTLQLNLCETTAENASELRSSFLFRASYARIEKSAGCGDRSPALWSRSSRALLVDGTDLCEQSMRETPHGPHPAAR